MYKLLPLLFLVGCATSIDVWYFNKGNQLCAENGGLHRIISGMDYTAVCDDGERYTIKD